MRIACSELMRTVSKTAFSKLEHRLSKPSSRRALSLSKATNLITYIVGQSLTLGRLVSKRLEGNAML